MLKRLFLLMCLFVASCSFDIASDVTCSADEVRPQHTCIDGVWISDESSDPKVDAQHPDDGGDGGDTTEPKTCSEDGTDDVCECTESRADFCSRIEACGTVTADDRCGNSQTYDCEGCDGEESCGGGGTANKCGCDARTACDAMGYECGEANLGAICANLGTESCGRCGPGTCTNHLCVCNAGYAFNGTTCADIDECAATPDTCDENATCTNTAGTFACTCNAGYTGDGVTCTPNVPQIVEIVSGSGDGATVTTENIAGSTNDDVYLAFVSIRTRSREVQSMSGFGSNWSKIRGNCDGLDRDRLEIWGTRGAFPAGQLTVQLNRAPLATVVTVIHLTNVKAMDSTGNFVEENASPDNTCSGGLASTSYNYNYPSSADSLVIAGVTTESASHTAGAGWTEIFDGNLSRDGDAAGLAVMTRTGIGANVAVAGTFSGSITWASITLEVYGP